MCKKYAICVRFLWAAKRTAGRLGPHVPGIHLYTESVLVKSKHRTPRENGGAVVAERDCLNAGGMKIEAL